MKKTFRIGKKEYRFKKDAILHYRTILNSYDFGQSLNQADFDDLIDLLDYEYFNYLIDLENAEENIEEDKKDGLIAEEGVKDRQEELLLDDIKIARVQFNTKCFELFYNDNTSHYISYLMIINNKQHSQESLFYIACRNSIHADIRSVKQAYFDQNSVKGQVKCQETGKLSTWTELAVDHRQPNTFSIIVDRFKEVNKIDLDFIEYTSNKQNHIIFENANWTENFKIYHKEKANLRIVRKECNSSRTGLARIKKSTKDLAIK